MSDRTGQAIRQQLKHPIIDCDGHWLESTAVLAEYLRDVAGADLTQKYLRIRSGESSWYSSTDEERFHQRHRRGGWWAFPTNTKDNATFRLPKLLYERMNELGIDFSLVLPTTGLSLEGIRDAEIRGAVIRAYNTMVADLFSPFSDRMTPVGVVPRRTPKEAIDELRFSVQELHLKAVLISGTVHRRSASNERFIDALGLDNDEDYDPLWQACQDLGVAVMSHAGATTWSNFQSVTNYVFNHIGHFAQANHTFAKAVFLGGLVNRFPNLNFAFLEGGVGYARNLYLDLLGHFDKRTYEAGLRYTNPANLDIQEMRGLIETYGHGRLRDMTDAIISDIDGKDGGALRKQFEREHEHIHDFAASGVASAGELAVAFTKNFYFGCEADDPMTALAYDSRMGRPLKAIFSSDISHFDLPDISVVLEEAYELVEHEIITPENFRDFTFSNAVQLHGKMNPDFFKGTVVEAEATAELARLKAAS